MLLAIAQLVLTHAAGPAARPDCGTGADPGLAVLDPAITFGRHAVGLTARVPRIRVGDLIAILHFGAGAHADLGIHHRPAALVARDLKRRSRGKVGLGNRGCDQSDRDQDHLSGCG
jgi:hypothetical protein